MNAVRIALALAVLLLAMPVRAADEQLVYAVESVDFRWIHMSRVTGELTVTGSTRQGGWTDMRLVYENEFESEPSEIRFRLVGTPPDGPATDAITPFTLTIEPPAFRYAMTKIRVIAETNEMTADIPPQ